jgi:hypothetical protein
VLRSQRGQRPWGRRKEQGKCWRSNTKRPSESYQVIQALAEHLDPIATPEEDAPVRKGHRYLTNRTDCLDYPRALKLGLPIGSGLIESGHRHVLQARLKKGGAAWLIEHADRIANLRVLRDNNQWLRLWN